MHATNRLISNKLKRGISGLSAGDQNICTGLILNYLDNVVG